MRTFLILGTGITKRETWWDAESWAEKPLPQLSWDIHQRDTTDSLVEEAAGIAGVSGWAILLRGYHDAGFRSAALKTSILNYTGPLATGTFPALLPWIDTGALSSIAKDATGKEVAFDFASDVHCDAFWFDFLKPFYDQFPEGGRIRHERSTRGRRLIAWWGIDSGIGADGKPWPGQGIVNQHLAQRLIDRINMHAGNAGLGELDDIVDTTWRKHAPGLSVHAVHDWFSAIGARGAYSIRTHAGIVTGAAVPGFHDPPLAPLPHRVIERRGGQTLRDALKAFRDAKCDYVLLEGHTDDTESAGFYRSSAWSPSTRELDSIREHILMADPLPKAKGIRFGGKFAGISPEKPDVVYVDRDMLGSWEAVSLTQQSAGWWLVRFIAANRALGIDPTGKPVSLLADTTSPLAKFTLNGTTLEPARVLLTVEEGVIKDPDPVDPPDLPIPPAPTRLPITQIAGVDFFDKNGKRRVLNGVDGFLALRQFIDGGVAALKPFFAESKALDFDMWRVHSMGSKARNNVLDLFPQREPDYYVKVRNFADALNEQGILLLLNCFVDNQDVKLTVDHWKRLGDALRGCYCLLSGGNEYGTGPGDYSKNGFNPGELTPLDGIWCSRGSGTSDVAPWMPPFNFGEFHNVRHMPTMMYDSAASATFIYYEKKMNVPLIFDEPIGFAQAEDPGRRSADPKRAWQLARIYSALVGGVVYHNDLSQRGLLMTGKILECAYAWQDGMRID